MEHERDRTMMSSAAAPSSPALTALCQTVRVHDLTFTLRQDFPLGPDLRPHREALSDFAVAGFQANQWTLVEHAGTHIDAPAHFFPDQADPSQLNPADLVLPIARIDVSARAASNSDTAVTLADIADYEGRHGQLPDRAAVFMYSGWNARTGAPEGPDTPSAGGIPPSPGFAVETALWLLEHRNVVCIGVDSPSIDLDSVPGFPVHRCWLGAGRYAIEGLAGLSDVPAAGAIAFVGVIPLEHATGGPCRVLAAWTAQADESPR
jgi:kynurenine formamidase